MTRLCAEVEGKKRKQPLNLPNLTIYVTSDLFSVAWLPGDKQEDPKRKEIHCQ